MYPSYLFWYPIFPSYTLWYPVCPSYIVWYPIFPSYTLWYPISLSYTCWYPIYPPPPTQFDIQIFSMLHTLVFPILSQYASFSLMFPIHSKPFLNTLTRYTLISVIFFPLIVSFFVTSILSDFSHFPSSVVLPGLLICFGYSHGSLVPHAPSLVHDLVYLVWYFFLCISVSKETFPPVRSTCTWFYPHTLPSLSIR